MSSIHYRFRKSTEYQTIRFEGLSMTVVELRDAILEANNMQKSSTHKLEITNAQNREILHLDTFLVPKNSSVIVKKVPIDGQENVNSAPSSPGLSIPISAYQQQIKRKNMINGGGKLVQININADNGDDYIESFFAYNSYEELRKIFVGGVSKHINEDDLCIYFGQFGDICDTVIVRDRETGESRGFAFVTFDHADSVKRVFQHTDHGGHTLDGNAFVQVRRYFPKAGYCAGEKVQSLGALTPIPYRGMTVPPELKIFVGGIGMGTSEKDVKKHFSMFGPVADVDMPYHVVYKCPKGFAFVGFKNVESVVAAIRDRYHYINGKMVEVKRANDQKGSSSPPHKHVDVAEMGWNTYSLF